MENNTYISINKLNLENWYKSLAEAENPRVLYMDSHENMMKAAYYSRGETILNLKREIGAVLGLNY